MTKQKNGAFLILFKDDTRKEVFLVFRSDYPIWVLTGGGIEKGENSLKAALRETEEETGFKVKMTRPIGVYCVFNKQNKLIRKNYIFEGRRIRGDFKAEFSGCQGRWFDVNHLPKDLTQRTREKINDAAGFDGREFTKKIYQEPLLPNLPLLLRHPLGAGKYILNKYFRRF